MVCLEPQYFYLIFFFFYFDKEGLCNMLHDIIRHITTHVIMII